MSNNEILSSLDPQQLSNMSNLPQPNNNSNKRPGKRLSMPENKRLSTGRLLNLGQAAVMTTTASKTTSTANGHRRTSSTGNRRKSSMGLGSNINGVNSRRSMIPTNNRLSIYSANTSLVKDPRPLRDKNYQMQLQQKILDFLSYKNLFEIEMKHPLTNKTLRQPTQKDFVFIFQWLYKKIDPGYKFQKSIEQEVYFLLRTIKYPYLESINKSQISAVGGQHWPIFLGMLHWLVQLNITLMKLDEEEDNDEEEDENDNASDIVDKLYVRYVLKSYKLFLNNEDDYSEYRKELKQDFELSIKERSQKIRELQTQIDTLSKQFSSVKLQNDYVVQAVNKSKVLKDDTVKFQDYIHKMETSRKRWDSILTEIKANIEQQDLKLKETNEEKQNIYKELSSLGFTVNDLDKMTQDRERLTKNLENCNSKIDSTLKMVKEKEKTLSDVFYMLENCINSFNSTMYKICNLIDLKDCDVDLNFAIDSFDINLLSDEKLGFKPDQLVPELKDNKIKDNLLELKKWVTKKTHLVQDETIKLQEQLDLLQETINERNEELENLESKLSTFKLEYDQYYENVNQELSDINLEIEKTQRDLQILNFKKQESTVSVNQRLTNVKLEYENLKHDLNFSKLEVHNKVEKYLEFIINFKLNIQSNLEEFENLVIEECEQEFSENKEIDD